MRKIGFIFLVFTMMFAMLILTSMTLQKTEKREGNTQSIPPEVRSLLEKSCTRCHSETGSGMAKTALNFTKWDDYATEKKAKIGKSIFNEVSKNNMPPKRFLAENPNFALTEKEKNTICNWAETLKPSR